ncbi:Protein Flattop-like [Holothuria leucospilota]|uniref:Cilia- and flagella-associated protein 126 n=1 Tax=Holothuria leucospilota TaxID=206669 RepID=A0A9Q1H741_HOLLE|nr:Protein Flattop-like [Holothuria leucospilota]
MYFSQRPDSYEGFTQIVANDRGHLLEGVPRSKRSPWGEFVGTWDMPRQIPGNITTYVARGDPAITEIKTQRIVHEKFMENAKSPKKNLLMEPKAYLSKTGPTTPPATEVNGEETRPENPSPHSPSKLSKSPSAKENAATPPPTEAPKESVMA